ncbi:Prefoldin [Rozella allomycis CSF55]|uniref:Prefoldin n=1 Tax=Rozella allomycis (strain CSF55) TaxID=988480 RepID=A0A075AYH2_ROZAC|nr:Prefoldin domain-containing protein [Rozella allomycis CSF55]RKP21456.1 Prefoldin [Rozella allomycis CSF55]|eukprot:EPZ35332.1 Prefoldin domain-containing protein [Rozella allomycis CSF55]
MQEELQTIVSSYQDLQKESNKAISTREKLEAQLRENEAVLAELKLIKDGNKVFKIVGPVLIDQELDEAKTTISKRLEFINKEIKRAEGVIKTVQKKQQDTAAKKQQQGSQK